MGFYDEIANCTFLQIVLMCHSHSKRSFVLVTIKNPIPTLLYFPINYICINTSLDFFLNRIRNIKICCFLMDERTAEVFS